MGRAYNGLGKGYLCRTTPFRRQPRQRGRNFFLSQHARGVMEVEEDTVG